MSDQLKLKPHHMLYEGQDTKQIRIYSIAVLINGVISVVIYLWATIFYSSYKWIYLVLDILSLGLLIGAIFLFKRRREYNGIIIIFSSFFAVIAAVLLFDIWSGVPILYRIFIPIVLIANLVLLCYNYSIGQKRDRRKLSETKNEKLEKKMKLEDVK